MSVLGDGFATVSRVTSELVLSPGRSPADVRYRPEADIGSE